MSTKAIDAQAHTVSQRIAAVLPQGFFSDAHRPQALVREQGLTALSAVLLALFAPLAWWAHRHPIDVTDIKITRALQKTSAPTLRYGTTAVTLLSGSPKILRTLAFPIAFGFWKKQLRLEALLTVSIGLSSALFKEILQRTINRPRPSPLLVHVYTKANGKSFPSGHVISALSFWGWLMALGTLLIQRKQAWQKVLLSLSALLLGAIGPTRIYLGDHWASDVLGGYLFGGAYLGLFIQLYRTLKQRGVLKKG